MPTKTPTPITRRFTWDARLLRYRRGGRFVSARAVKLAVRAVVRKSQAEMRTLTDQMLAGQLGAAEWHARFEAELKNLHVAGGLAGQGGPANMTPADYLRIGRGLRTHYRYLDRFAGQVKAGDLSAAAIRRRAEMYVNHMQGAYEGGRQSAATRAGYTHERNALGDRRDHCRTGPHGRPGCYDLTQRGWVPIGTMPLPGSRSCLSACACVLKFRRAAA